MIFHGVTTDKTAYDSHKFHDQVGKVIYELCGGLQALQRCSVEELMEIYGNLRFFLSLNQISWRRKEGSYKDLCNGQKVGVKFTKQIPQNLMLHGQFPCS